MTLPLARQIVVTETGGNLRLIRDALRAVESPNESQRQTADFEVRHVTANEVLAVAGQLFGFGDIDTAASDGSIRLAVNPGGKRILATGQADMIRRFEEVLHLVDVPDPSGETRTPLDAMQLEVHATGGADPESSLQVMQTLLEERRGIRLTVDPQTGNLIALARPSDHQTIRTTLQQLRGEATIVDVIRLQVTQPEVAARAIQRLFVGATADAESEVLPKGAPRVDVDTSSGLLMVRGTERQIAQIRQLLTKLGERFDGSAPNSQLGNIRLLPMSGAAARSVLEQATRIWPEMRDNPIRTVTPAKAVWTMKPSQGNRDAPGARAVLPAAPETLREVLPVPSIDKSTARARVRIAMRVRWWCGAIQPKQNASSNCCA